MPDVNYSLVITASNGALSNTDTMCGAYTYNTNNASVGTNDSAGVLQDRSLINVAIFR